MDVLYRKGCNSRGLGALYEYEAAQGKHVSLETTGSDPTERERLADCVEQIAAARSRAAFAEVFEYFAPRLKELSHSSWQRSFKRRRDYAGSHAQCLAQG